MNKLAVEKNVINGFPVLWGQLEAKKTKNQNVAIVLAKLRGSIRGNADRP
jgi:hypothetical protein